MTENNNVWDYCTIKFQLRHKGEDFGYADNKRVWLVFQAIVSGHNQNYIAEESTEIPVAANLTGVAYTPQKNNASHVQIHQNLLQKLQEDGWELLTEKGSAWWERRLRRAALPEKSPFGWPKRKSDHIPY